MRFYWCATECDLSISVSNYHVQCRSFAYFAGRFIILSLAELSRPSKHPCKLRYLPCFSYMSLSSYGVHCNFRRAHSSWTILAYQGKVISRSIGAAQLDIHLTALSPCDYGGANSSFGFHHGNHIKISSRRP